MIFADFVILSCSFLPPLVRGTKTCNDLFTKRGQSSGNHQPIPPVDHNCCEILSFPNSVSFGKNMEKLWLLKAIPARVLRIQWFFRAVEHSGSDECSLLGWVLHHLFFFSASPRFMYEKAGTPGHVVWTFGTFDRFD